MRTAVGAWIALQFRPLTIIDCETAFIPISYLCDYPYTFGIFDTVCLVTMAFQGLCAIDRIS
ncbi:MAG: hypothetical protein BGO89_02295 [Candidatus Kapaibacterium thiocyanatum]|uniref:Uncharacterized protein n=1 Tax=Candidatus Kapaibacterium thiocyanatum TaxID=1895771 RepID=A0A1M3L226_9BACT|nr:MAG: hypothetical protein BGO89_02295 ['Candidatus Kapabacteria' thiocyanatum]